MASQGSQVRLLSRLLKATELRARVISANIANQNTPGYTRQVVRFEERLKTALLEGGRAEARRVRPQVELDTVSEARPDGNNVTLESELNDMRENRLMYETYAAILRGHFGLMQAAVDGSR